MGVVGVISLSSTDRILVLGDSGSGKTYLVENIILPAYKRSVVVTSDPTEFTRFPNRVVTISAEKTRETIEKACQAGNLMAAIDDTDIFFTRFENDDRVRYFLIASRHRGVGWCILVRRPTDIPPLVFTQANKVFVFQTDHPRELDLYGKYVTPDFAVQIKTLDRQAHHFLFYDRETRETRSMVV